MPPPIIDPATRSPSSPTPTNSTPADNDNTSIANAPTSAAAAPKPASSANRRSHLSALSAAAIAKVTPSSAPKLNPHGPSSPRQSEDDPLRHSTAKKLLKRRQDSGLQSHKTMEFPERLKQNDGGDEEILRPTITGNSVFLNVNQSIFGLIAAAGSRVNFNDRFEGHSSDDDDDDYDAEDARGSKRVPADVPSGLTATTVLPAIGSTKHRSKSAFKDISQSTIFTRNSSSSSSAADRRSRFSDSKLLRSLPSLKTKLSNRRRTSSGLSKSSKAAAPGDAAGSSRILEEDENADADSEVGSSTTPSSTQTRLPRSSEPDSETDGAASFDTAAPVPSISPAIQVTRAERSNSTRSIAPVMSRMLEAKAELVAARPSFDLDRRPSDKNRDIDADADAGGPSALARQLMEIFEFDKPEEVIEEYPCWLLQSVLLQGYMYITARHICFYAYLPKKANEVAKSGYLAKSGKRNPKYNRYWFRLKGDVLSYYRDSSKLYFPHGQIDLRYGISATVTSTDKDGVHFQVVTHQRTYYFRADSAPSAKEWVKSLQRVIFRSHNEGDSVKISLPIENVIDIEENQAMVEFTDTCKIRVIDNDETFAIDDYFFSFFGEGRDAVRILKILVEGANQQESPNQLGLPSATHVSDRRASQDSSSAFGEAAERMSSSASLNVAQQPGASSSEGKLAKTAKLRDAVRATLSVSPAGESPRASGEITRGSIDIIRSSFGGGGRRSMDLSQALGGNPIRRSFSERGGRRSASHDDERRTSAQIQSDHQESTDSFIQSSIDDPSQVSFSNIVASSSEDPSASQILHGSDVFQSPTVARRSASASRRPERHRSQHAQQAATPTGNKTKFAVGSNVAGPRAPHHAATTGQIGDQEGGQAMGMPGDGEDGSLAQNLAKFGTFPLQRAGAYAGWLNRTSRRMSSLLATESMGYVEKVSGMWKGGRQHYDDAGLDPRTDDEMDDPVGVSGSNLVVSNERFREHFALPDTEKLQATFFGYMMRVLPLYGKIYISQRFFCFRSLLPGTRTKLILPLKDIENVAKEKGFRFGYSGLVVVIRGHEELFFEFGQVDMRDDCTITLLHVIEKSRFLKESGLLDEDEKADAEAALAERDALQKAREIAAAQQFEHPETLSDTSAEATTAATAAATAAAETISKAAQQKKMILRQSTLMSESPTFLFDDPKASFLNFKPAEPLRITCLTIGSRGDVQPYIALGRGLLAEGHHVRIATHPEFEDWIRSHGLDYGRVEGDPGELMRICIENGTFTLNFLREANAKMRTWLDELLASAWTACQGSDLLIESPSAMAGIHIAEKLQIPYFRAFTMPWTRTRAYPHAFLIPDRKLGGAYNHFTYVMFEAVFWKATSSQINRWRNQTLGLRNTSLEKMQINKVPFLYNFSPSVVPPPLDYSDWIRVTGYWFLNEGTAADSEKKGAGSSDTSGADSDGGKRGAKMAKAAVATTAVKTPPWTPPKDLADFIAKARKDRKKIVYVGFGSILVNDPAKMTQEVIDAVLKADVRCILSKGWSDRMVSAKEKEAGAPVVDASKVEVPLPAEIFQIKSAPHDWLFAQIDAAAHHGGSGTTGASLRAGIPTIIRPFFGDQFFFGGRVEDLGVGICLKKWGAISFARALWEATNSERMIKKAAALGEQIREENGVDTAIQCIYRDMEYAKSLVKAKAAKSGMMRSEEDGGVDDFDDEEPEESWTFVGEDDPMQQSMILTPDTGVRAPASSKTLGSRILGIATAQRQ